jgi:phage shock protein PspC (stress-responsive transcriptional regulator)
MKRVTIVNLAGRAYHVEEDGVAALDAWFDTARARLAADPDMDELVLDFERAIAERLETHVTIERDVVTTTHVRDALDALGAVEPVDADAGDAAAPSGGAAGVAAGDDTSWRQRRLYRLTGEEAMLGGVCAGLAAYLRMDVTVVRVLVVILTVVTSGVAAIIYIAMAFVVPEADSPDKRAAVRGYGDTAQEMISRAREGAGPALQSLGSLISTTWRVIARVLHGLFISIAWIVGVAWAVQVTWLWINGGGIASMFDAGTSTWLIALWLTCIAWIFVGVAIALASAFDLVSGEPYRRRRSRPREVFTGTLWSAAMIGAWLGLFAIPASTSKQLSSLTDGATRLALYDHHVCVTAGDHARPGSCTNGDVDIVLE